MNSRARRAATLTSGAGAVLTFVALLIPQVADTLSLTTLGKILAAVAIGLFTACGQRMVSFRRARAAIQAALRSHRAVYAQLLRLPRTHRGPGRDRAARQVGREGVTGSADRGGASGRRCTPSGSAWRRA